MTLNFGIDLITVRGDDLDRAIQGIVAGAAAEYLCFQHWILRPVRRFLILLDQLSRTAQRIALEIEGFLWRRSQGCAPG